MTTLALLLTFAISAFAGGGDTYPLTDNIAFRNEVKPSFGLALCVNNVNPTQVQGTTVVVNYLVAITGTYSTTNDANTYGPNDTKAGTEKQFYGAYVGYVPGEFRIQVLDNDIVACQFLAIGLGWQHTSQLYTSHVQEATETYAVAPQGRWNTRAKLQVGNIVSYKHLGILTAVGSGSSVIIGLQFNLN